MELGDAISMEKVKKEKITDFHSNILFGDRQESQNVRRLRGPRSTLCS